MSALAGRHVVLTGGRGFLGAALASQLVGRGARVTTAGRTPPAAKRPGMVDITCDVRERAAWDKLVPDADVIVHLAGQTSVYAAEADPILDARANLDPVLHLLAAARASGRRPHVVFAGTTTQRGIPSSLPVSEDDVDEPCSVYDLHKLTAERHLLLADARGDVTACSLRLPNIYGPGPRSGSADRGILNATIRKALAMEPIQVWGDGRNVRDYLFVEDAARAFLLAAERPTATRGQRFILGTGVGTRVVDAMRLARDRVAALRGRASPLELVPAPSTLHPIEARDFVADARRFRAAAGWQAAVSLQDGIDRTILSYAGELP